MAVRILARAEWRQGWRGHLAVLAMLALVATALTIAAVIGRMADKPWERTWLASGAPHLTLFSPDEAGLEEARARVPGVTASSGPVVSGFVGLHAGRYHVETRLVGQLSGLGGPVLVEGSTGEFVLERTFARSLGVAPGDTVTFDTRSGPRTARVSGLAVVSGQESYPLSQPGLSFGTPALLEEVGPSGRQRFVTEALRLSDPAAAQTIVDALPTGGRELGAQSWQSERDDVSERIQSVQIALNLLSALLVLCAAPIVATLVSERILARAREFAILRAAGLTPANVIGLTALLYGGLGLLGGALGLLAGTLLTPAVTAASEELLAAPGLVRPSPTAVAVVVLGTAGLAAVSAALPAWLLSRRPAAAALVAAAAPGRRRPSRVARLARRARLPIAAVLGAGEAFARRPRALLAVFALALPIAAGVAAMSMEYELGNAGGPTAIAELRSTAYSGGEPFDFFTSDDSEARRVRSVVYPGVGALLLLGLANLVAVLALAQREGRRDTGILRAVGLTPGDAALTVIARQLTIACVAALCGVPLGLGIWWLGTRMGDDGGVSFPPAPALLAGALLAVAVCTLVTIPLARAAARLPVTRVLRQE